MPKRNAKAPRSKVVPEPFRRQAGSARPVVPTASNPHLGQSPRHPVAPPVYRPEAKKIVQPKVFSPQRKSLTPPGYRLEQKTIAQPKTATAGSRSAKRSPFAPFSVRAMMSRFGGSLQCARHPVPQPQPPPSRESLIQAAKDLGLLAETVKDALGKSPRGVDTRALSNGMHQAWELGREAQEDIRYERDLNPQLPQAYAGLLALYNSHERAVRAYKQSDRWLEEAIAESNRQSFANNPLTAGWKFHGS